ncbi:hypothetical protein BAUCODRAFT_37976 [Baudoinia panamericana UAMH 10762]|uniref:RRM domain-containing protein n=1 Tax=Baudoinia panamericana (strain UAMH 10762) TaxID=717646 RepID=M2LG89_BAUPA|nr:uncharacterized protein BAUCODRAFT_37976 [Baudoinia panamericana UAMH 10762]EMC93057.1 hypothetical protein BAUCODRAFT_37976 [Baudoinia panamericana UAMH 10762]
MGDNKTKMAISLDDALQASRKERNAQLAQNMLGTNPQKLVDQMLGAGRRTSTPRPPMSVAGTLASRAGVVKRSASIPRSSAPPARNSRTPLHLSRPPVAADNYRPSPARNPIVISSSDPPSDAKSNGHVPRQEMNGRQEANGDPGLSIRGAARGEFVVRAEGFLLGTTAADIESVMQSVGGMMSYCKLITSQPSVIAEMSFPERLGAEKVIETFNGKKADGCTLYVHMHSENGVAPYSDTKFRRQEQPQPEEPSFVVDTTGDVAMEVDEHADARAIEDRQREERRREARPPPSGPAGRQQQSGYPREPRRAEPEFQDGRYGFDNRDNRYGRGGGGPGRFREEGRLYSDRMRRGGAQSYRP